MNPPRDQAARDRLVNELETSFAVGAGAGSGKTRVLVDRVIQLVDRGFDLERIVAITFTEKASAELRERVRAVLSAMPEPRDDSVRKRRLEALGKIDYAQLTTIHGFCRSILAKYPLEAGVTPGFTVLDRLQSDLLLDETASDVISLLREEDCEELEGALLAGGRLAGLRGLARAVLRFPDLEPELPGPAAEELEAVAADLLETARGIAGYADSVPSRDRLMQQAVRALELRSQLVRGETDPHDLATALRRVKIHRNAGARDNWKTSTETAEAFVRFKEEWGVLSRRREEALDGYEGRHLSYLVEKAKGIKREFERRKAELGALDFDDLLLKTEALLNSDRSVVEQIKESIQFVLVDEFQDTDPIQVRIVQRLTEAVDRGGGRIEDAVPGAGRLFLVGDANQSIYRFRRADLSVFRTARSQLVANGEEARLEVNFRSTPALVRVANQVFPHLLEAGEYGDLIAHREEDASGPAVSLLDLDPFLEDRPAVDEVRVAEARSLAGWIRDRIDSGWEVFDKAFGEWRPVAYRDIAVLIRTYTGVPLFENELERCGIPYRISGGRAFFHRLEILQTLPILHALSDPEDEVAVVASFRSPFFGVSDESLVRWAASGRSFTYLDEGDDPVDEAFIELHLDGTADAPLLEARRILAGLHCQARSCSPSGLLWKIYQTTRALPLHALKPDGDRRMANLLKLADLAYAYEEAAAGLMEGQAVDFVSLNGLVRFLEEQRRAAVEEESVIVEGEGDAVTLMTIHAAKGLEFPVVALLDRSYSGEFRDRAIPNRAEGTVTVTGAGLKPPGWKERREAEAAEQEAEAKRLLYVAFTRARDHVVLCGRRSEEGGNRGFLAPLEGALRLLAEGYGGGDEPSRLVEWVTPSMPALREPVPHRLPQDLEEPSGEELEAAVTGRLEAEGEWRGTVLRAMRSRVTRASKLDSTFFPDRPGGESRHSMESRRHARLRGIRVHRAMELAVLLVIRPDEACRIVSEPGDSGDLESQVRELVERGVALLEQAKREGWKVVATEWPLLLGNAGTSLPGVVDDWVEVLTGTADLILEDGEGRLIVADYKTGPADSAELLSLYRRQLEAYRTMLERSTGRAASAEIWSLSTGERIQLT